MSYVISHELGPYFRDLLIKDIKNCHAQANRVVDGILGAFRTDSIDISKLLILSRDNSNVNKTVEKMINDAMKKVNAELLNVGTCNLHAIHNGFKAGTTETNWHVENFCMNIWSWFQKSPAREEDFENITDELNDAIEKTILYFSSTRQVLLGKVIDRVFREEARRLLVDVSASDRATFFHDVKLVYHAIADNLKKHFPLKTTFLKDLHVLDPASRTKQDSADTMIRVGRAVPKLLINAQVD
ncbi:unnamed protein product [Rotaria magnacalcarata]|uniref:Uncharacterized protein n=1 Tax=Rotaria magnacalcarata TaxID=392030 RepID=A0A816W4D7_9BILA|nr:unnamed protein product [Rotaria magnacalcarata]